MSAVPLLLAPADGWTARGVLDLLRDWAACGLVRPFLWVDEADLAHASLGSRVACTSVIGATARRRLLADHLADARGVDGARLVVLGAPGADDAGTGVVRKASASSLEAAVRQGFSSVVAVHCLLPRHGQGGWRPDVDWAGWHTVVVSPEEAWFPGSFPEVLHVGGDDEEFLAHAAAAVCSVAGLWSGMDEAPFDAQTPPPGGSAVVVRSFVRRLDASAVDTALRAELTDVTAGFPTPRGQVVVEPAQHPATVAATVVDRLVAKHRALFARDRRVPRPPAQRAVGGMAAVRMLVQFLRTALIGAPRRFADRVVGQVSSGLARQLSDTVFGQDSAYAVVVGGRDGRGRVAGIDAMLGGAEQMAARLGSVGGPVDISVPPTGPFWQDVVGGALTLVDAGQRLADVEPVTVGGLLVHLRHPDDVAPAPTEPFVPRGRPAQYTASDPVARHDLLGIGTVRAALQHMVSTDPDAALEATAELDRLSRFAGPLERSYVGAVGGRVATMLGAARDDVAALRSRLAAAGDHRGTPPDLIAQQERVAVVQRVALGLALLVVVLALVAGWRDWLGWVTVAVVVLVTVVVWAVSALLLFLQLQKALFQYVHRRQEMDAALEADRYNLVQAVREMHRAFVLYRQYLQWAPVLGQFLHQPFGSRSEVEPDVLRLDGDLPRAVWLGRAAPDPEAVQQVAYRLGDRVFTRGWLGRQWDDLLATAPSALGAPGQAIAADPRRLYDDAADRPDALLRRWRAVLEADGTGPGLGDRLWSDAVRAMDELGADLVQRPLLGNVELIGRGADQGVAGSDLLDDLTRAVSTGQAHTFDLGLFGPRAQGLGAQQVGSAAVAEHGGASLPAGAARTLTTQTSGAGLDRFVVLLQLSRAVAPSELRLDGDPSEVAPTTSTPDGPDTSRIDF